MARARILVADDHEEVRNMIVSLLERQFDVLAAVADGPTFLEAVAGLKPDLGVLDISMPKMSGIEVAYRVKQSDCQMKIVFLTLHDDPDCREAALATGAEGFVTKSRMGGDLLFAVSEVLAGRKFCTSLETNTKLPERPS